MKLNLSVAIGDYDRTRPLVDGSVQIDGVEPVFSLLEPEEIFFRAFRHAEFDVCELSLSSFAVKTARDECPYVGVPVFPSRAFRHTSIYVRNDRGIERPEDLRGKRVGVPEYQLTANVWVRAILEKDYGVSPADISWVCGGYEEPGRIEKIALNLPDGVVLENAPSGETISGMLARGDIDAIIGPRAPSCFERGDPAIRWLWDDPSKTAIEWYGKHRVFPIMHLLGVRRDLVERYPYLPAALLKAFTRAKAVSLAQLRDTSATKVTLPFVEEQLRRAQALMGADFWSYGYAQNVHVLDMFLDAHHKQGLSARRLEPAMLFHPTTLEAHKI